MTSYICYVGDVAVGGGDEIYQIATDAFAGASDSINFIEFADALDGWNERLLDAVREVELILNPCRLDRLISDEREKEEVRKDQQGPDALPGHDKGRSRPGHVREAFVYDEVDKETNEDSMENHYRPYPGAPMAHQYPRIEDGICTVHYAQK